MMENRKLYELDKERRIKEIMKIVREIDSFWILEQIKKFAILIQK